MLKKLTNQEDMKKIVIKILFKARIDRPTEK